MGTVSGESAQFVDDDHALMAGFLAGMFLKSGVKCSLIRDDAGNYTPFMELVVLEPGEIEPIRVTIKVMAAGFE